VNYKRWLIFLGVALILGFSIWCMIIPKMTFMPNDCTYSGPKTRLFGVFKFFMVVKAQQPVRPGFAIITLKNGKTFADLQAWSSVDTPPWSTLISRHEDQTPNGIYTIYLKRYSIWHQGEPIYIICFERDSNGSLIKVGAVGPIHVIK
jgi:hypothetical protein